MQTHADTTLFDLDPAPHDPAAELSRLRRRCAELERERDALTDQLLALSRANSHPRPKDL